MTRWLLMAACLVLLGGCGSRASKPPALTNLYATNLAAYWQEVAMAAGVEPEEPHLRELRVVYDDTGQISQFRLSFVTRGSDGWRWCVLNKDDGDLLHWQVETLESGPSNKGMSVADAMAQLQQVGARRLTEHAGFQAPVRINLFGESSQVRYSRPEAFVLDQGEIRPVGADGVVMPGAHGRLMIQEDTGQTNRWYVIPGY